MTLITVGYLAGWPQFKGSWGVGPAGVILLAALVVGNRFSLGVAPVAVLQPIPYKGGLPELFGEFTGNILLSYLQAYGLVLFAQSLLVGWYAGWAFDKEFLRKKDLPASTSKPVTPNRP